MFVIGNHNLDGADAPGELFLAVAALFAQMALTSIVNHYAFVYAASS